MDQHCYDSPTKEIVQRYIDAHPDETIALSYNGDKGLIVKIVFGRRGGVVYEMDNEVVGVRNFNKRETLLEDYQPNEQVDLNAVSLVRVLGWIHIAAGCSKLSTTMASLIRLQESGLRAISKSITTSHEQHQTSKDEHNRKVYARKYLLEALGGYIVMQDVGFQPARDYADAVEKNTRIYYKPEVLIRNPKVPSEMAIKSANDLHELASQYVRTFDPEEEALVAYFEGIMLEPHKQPVKQRRVPSYD